jgi:PAS domain S-box-containing protein
MRDLSPKPSATEQLARRGAQLELAERAAQIGSWEWNRETQEFFWSDNLFRIFGVEPGAISPTPESVLERTHPNDRAIVERAIARRLNGDGSEPLVYRIIRTDGEVRHLRCSLSVAGSSNGRPGVLVGSVQDLTDARRASREIAAHVAVSEALAEWNSLEHGGAALLRKLGEAMEFEVGTLWLVEQDALAARPLWHSPAVDVPEFESVTRALRLKKGVGLPGRAWDARQPIGVVRLLEDVDLARDPHGARRQAAARAGLRSAVALPAMQASDVLAVVDFFSFEAANLTDRLMRSLSSIGHQLGRFLAGRRGELQPPALTPRELEVLRLAAQGESGPEIAARLFVSPATIKTHFEHIYTKFGVCDRASAVAEAFRLGLLS